MLTACKFVVLSVRHFRLHDNIAISWTHPLPGTPWLPGRPWENWDMSLSSSGRDSKRRDKDCKPGFYHVSVLTCIMGMNIMTARKAWMFENHSHVLGTSRMSIISLICHYCSLSFAVVDGFDYGIEMMDGTERCAKSSGLTIICLSFLVLFSVPLPSVLCGLWSGVECVA